MFDIMADCLLVTVTMNNVYSKVFTNQKISQIIMLLVNNDPFFLYTFLLCFNTLYLAQLFSFLLNCIGCLKLADIFCSVVTGPEVTYG